MDGNSTGPQVGAGHEEHEHEHEKPPGFLFRMADSLPAFDTCISLMILIVVTVFFEVAKEMIQDALKPYPHYSEMMSHVFSELTILGFISFSVTIIIDMFGEKYEVGQHHFSFLHLSSLFVACAGRPRGLFRGWTTIFSFFHSSSLLLHAGV
jgi:hypothetical protein